jgi:hypothetical protein
VDGDYDVLMDCVVQKTIKFNFTALVGVEPGLASVGFMRCENDVDDLRSIISSFSQFLDRVRQLCSEDAGIVTSSMP